MKEQSIFDVWLIDDEEVFRETMTSALRLEKGFAVRAFESCDMALRALSEETVVPDVILLDISMPGISGLQALPAFLARSPSTKVLMLTANQAWGVIGRAMRAGAFGYIQKTAGLVETLSAIDGALAGHRYLDGRTTDTLVDHVFDGNKPVKTASLTNREKEVLVLLAAGLDRKGIAGRLGIAVETVVSHQKALYTKLDVHKLSQAVRIALEEGLV